MLALGGLRYVAVGDSVPRGFRFGIPRLGRRDRCDVRIAGVPLRWFDDPAGGYPAHVAARLRSVLGVPVELDTSATCSGLATRHLWRNGAPSRLVEDVFAHPADVVTVTLGANDLLPVWSRYFAAATIARSVGLGDGRLRALTRRLAPDPRRVAALAGDASFRLSALLAWISQRSPGAPIVVTGYYSGDDAEVTRTRFARPLQRAIRLAVEGCPAARLVDLEPIFDGRARALTGKDGLHPTEEAHRHIGDRVADEALRWLVAPRRPPRSAVAPSGGTVAQVAASSSPGDARSAPRR